MFWKGWQFEEETAGRILYKIADDSHVFQFNSEAEGESYADENVVDIDTELAIERNSLISCIRNPSRLSSFNEEMSRKSIADLQVAEEFKAAKFTNMDMNKRKVLVQSIVTALRSRLECEPNSVLYAFGSYSPCDIMTYDIKKTNAQHSIYFFRLFRRCC